MSTLEVSDIPETWLQRLDARAREQGRDRSQIVREILARELDHEDTPDRVRGFDVALAPIRQGFAESGESEEILTALLDEGLRSARRQSDSIQPDQSGTRQQ